jgi:hypothetical protein
MMVGDKPIYLLHWEDIVEAKARPRCGCTSQGNVRVLSDEKYKNWKQKACGEFVVQSVVADIPRPIQWPVHLIVLFTGKHLRARDYIDNVPGAIADALVDAQVLAGDNGKVAPGAAYHLRYSDSDPKAYIAIAPATDVRGLAGQLIELADWMDNEAA